MMLEKEQILELFMGWHVDPEQTDDWLRLDKGVKGTDDKVCYAYFRPTHVTIPVKDAPIHKVFYSFDRFEIQ